MTRSQGLCYIAVMLAQLFQLSLLRANDLGIESNKVAITFKELRRHEIDRLRDEKPALLDRNEIQSKTLGRPQVLCTDHSIGITFDTAMPFVGRIFASRHGNLPRCMQHINQYFSGAATHFEMALNARDCGLQMKRVTNPQPGIEYTAKIVVSFHPEFLTEDDQLYNIKCSYYQADTAIGSFFEVSVFPTQMVIGELAMPDCAYSLHINSVDGPEIAFAQIGDKVFHQWKCASDLYAIKVYQCFVHDGKTRKYLLIDDRGCAIDTTILPNLSYDLKLNSAYTSSNVFRFADSSRVFFNCLLYVCPKADPTCLAQTPPECDSNNSTSTSRFARATLSEMNEMTVNATVPIRPRVVNSAASNNQNNKREPVELSTAEMIVLDLEEQKNLRSYLKESGALDSACPQVLASGPLIVLLVCNFLTLTVATPAVYILCRRHFSAQVDVQT